MVTTSSLKVIDAALPDMDWWRMAKEQAAELVESGFLPASIKTASQALAIMMKGRELGVPPMFSLSDIFSVNGRPECSSRLMLALILRDHGDDAVIITTSTDTVCVAQYKRRSWKQARTHQFTIEEAKRAGLVPSDPKVVTNWTKYPAAMLRARTITSLAKLAFPDSIGGMYSYGDASQRPSLIVVDDVDPEFDREEIAPPPDDVIEVEGVFVTTDGEIVDAGVKPIEEPAPEPEKKSEKKPATTPKADPLRVSLAAKIDASTNSTELAAAALDIQSAVKDKMITPAERADLEALYREKRTALGGSASASK